MFEKEPTVMTIITTIMTTQNGMTKIETENLRGSTIYQHTQAKSHKEFLLSRTR